MNKTVKKGDTILLHYMGRCKNGKAFDSTLNRDPIPVEVGAGEMIEGLDKAVLGL